MLPSYCICTVGRIFIFEYDDANVTSEIVKNKNDDSKSLIMIFEVSKMHTYYITAWWLIPIIFCILYHMSLCIFIDITIQLWFARIGGPVPGELFAQEKK